MTREQLRAALTDPIALTCTLFGEAAGEPLEGQLAVACVIRNRVQRDINNDGKPDWWGEGYAGTCLKSALVKGREIFQFSCWQEQNANTARVYALAESMLKLQPVTGLIAELRWLAEGIIGDVLRDRTRGADHYLTTALWKSPAAPPWSLGTAPVATVGRHTFFRLY